MHEYKRFVIAIDFDGTIAEDKYPEIGPILPMAKNVINKLYRAGHFIIINTCRVGGTMGDVEKFLEEMDVHHHYINTNLPSKIREYGVDCRKISADIYIDDKNLMHISDWGIIAEQLTEKGVIF
jgi:hydroxymethylpyrimidine pyrophosphatase-like HAD family hydrolase